MSMKIVKKSILVGGVFVLGLFAGLFGAMIATDPGDNLTLVESEFRTTSSGERRLTGAVRNNTDHGYAFLQVDIILLDEEGGPVERTFATTSDLAAFSMWNFEVPIIPENAVRAVISGQCGRRYRIHEEIVAPSTAQ